MSALESLIGLLELRKADGLVLVAGEPPSLLGGRDRSLTMPPLDAATVTGFLEELFSPEQRALLVAGQPVETEHCSPRSGAFVVKARPEQGRTRIVVRRGALRAASPSPSPSPPSSSAPWPTAAAPSSASASAAAALPLSAPGHGWGLLMPLLARAVEEKASDLILSSGQPPVLKSGGEAVRVDGPVLEEGELAGAFDGLLGEERRRRFAQVGSVDLGLDQELPGHVRPVRFRVNLFRRHGGLTAVLRPIWELVPSLEELGLPRALRRVVEQAHGLVLFAGPTGSGKSTTLAALVALINQSRACHVLTLEEPIEYLFPPGRAVVHQREVGEHVRSFADGLRAALRESPDVILVGEMRDPETIALALTAAETGHLVLSTIHAGSAMGAVERVVGALPELDRSAVRAQLASALRHVVVQHLLPATGGSGLVPAVGILAVNHAVAAQIREGRTQLLATQMEIGADEGMVTLESALAELVRSGRVSREAAMAATTQREALEALLSDRPASRPPRA
ncbi:MAG: PilT/PilU family type 4a pilus ATPase [Deltaproteobacteria bacterium]|nr:PilT/PilU family type 4a pilus ATPase [Deltaproteobacteria bacterium]